MVTQSSLQGILASVFGVDPKYVVPKQGNWYDPQTTADQAATWVAYLLSEGNPTGTAYYQQGVTSLISTVPLIGTLELQIIGDMAEILARGILHWLHRPDIVTLFDNNQAQLAADELGRFRLVPYRQGGQNNILAYNVNVGLQWVDLFQSTMTKLTVVEFNPPGTAT